MNQTYLIRYRKEFQAQWVDFKRDCVDFNDLLYIAERTDEEIVGWEPVGMKKNRAHFNATTFFLRGGKKKTVFHVKPIYYVNTSGSVRPLSEVTLYHGNRNMQLTYDWAEKMDFGYLAWLIKRCALIGGGVSYSPSKIPVMLNTITTVYPDPDPETTTVDGVPNRSSVNEIFSTIRAGAGVGSSDSIETLPTNLTSSTTTDQYTTLQRPIMLFDTSSIPDGDVKNSAILSLFGVTKLTGVGTPELDIVSSAPASNTAIVAGDFTTLGTTIFVSITNASYSVTAYNDLTLNSDGLTNITFTGVSKFGARLDWDTDNNFTGTWASDNASRFTFNSADEPGTTKDPKLAVTHGVVATGGGATSALLMMAGA